MLRCCRVAEFYVIKGDSILDFDVLNALIVIFRSLNEWLTINQVNDFFTNL